MELRIRRKEPTVGLEHLWILVSMAGPGTNVLRKPREEATRGEFLCLYDTHPGNYTLAFAPILMSDLSILLSQTPLEVDPMLLCLVVNIIVF